MTIQALVEVVYRNQDARYDKGEDVTGLVEAKEWGRAGSATTLLVKWSDGDEYSVAKGDLVELDTWAAQDAAKQFQVNGVGPEAPLEINENGASQSKTGFAATSLPPKALLAVAAIQKHGDDKYGIDNWRGVSIRDHLNHAQVHYLAMMAGDAQDKHFEHYATRVLMALELHLEQEGIVG